MSALKAIPTNVITGFLGVGKSTAILNLLKQKPDNERWAVLVNEFGEVGIDGSLFTGQKTEEAGIFIREVPGGCMCCAAGLPMQIALNMLLKTPDSQFGSHSIEQAIKAFTPLLPASLQRAGMYRQRGCN